MQMLARSIASDARVAFDPWIFSDRFPERRYIPATEVVRVLQRVAEGQAEAVNFQFSVSGQYLCIKADGWYLVCGVCRDELDFLLHCVTPTGRFADLSDWPIESDPIEMLGDATAWSVVRRAQMECRS